MLQKESKMKTILSRGFMLLLFCGLNITRTCYCKVYNASDEKRLFEYLFSDYKVYILPRENSSVPLYVSIKPYFLFLDDVDVKRQTITARIFFELKWEDKLLIWDTENYSGIEKIKVPYNMLWTPDICIAGAVGDFTDIGKEGTAAVVYSTGNVIFWPIKVFEITCVVDIRKYPFDEHSCAIDLSSWTFDDNFIQMLTGNDSIDLSMLTPSGEWEFKSEHVYYHTKPFGILGYSHVTFPFKIRRRWQFIILNTFFPTLCTSLLTLMCFWLPKESGERVGLSISIFLTLAVFMTVTSKDLPETADAVSLLGAYVALQLAWSGMTIVLTVISLVIAFKDDNNCIPMWLQTLARSRNSCTIKSEYTENQSAQTETESESKSNGYVNNLKENGMTKGSSRRIGHGPVTWDNVAVLLNTVCFYGSIAFQLCLNLWFLIRSVQ